MVQLTRGQFFENAEVVLERKLRKNPTHPFRYLCDDGRGDPVYVHSRRPTYFYLSLICAVGSVLVLTIWLIAGGDREFILFGVLGFFSSCYLCIEYHNVYSIVLEPFVGQYTIYADHTLITTQQAHNIYIRLQKQKTGFRQTKYYLAINGYGFGSPIIISGLTAKKTKLRALAQGIAKELNMNYFDLQDTSKLHIIRHHPTIPNIRRRRGSLRRSRRIGDHGSFASGSSITTDLMRTS